jgi:hypothetical protein
MSVEMKSTDVDFTRMRQFGGLGENPYAGKGKQFEFNNVGIETFKSLRNRSAVNVAYDESKKKLTVNLFTRDVANVVNNQHTYGPTQRKGDIEEEIKRFEIIGEIIGDLPTMNDINDLINDISDTYKSVVSKVSKLLDASEAATLKKITDISIKKVVSIANHQSCLYGILGVNPVLPCKSGLMQNSGEIKRNSVNCDPYYESDSRLRYKIKHYMLNLGQGMVGSNDKNSEHKDKSASSKKSEVEAQDDELLPDFENDGRYKSEVEARDDKLPPDFENDGRYKSEVEAQDDKLYPNPENDGGYSSLWMREFQKQD